MLPTGDASGIWVCLQHFSNASRGSQAGQLWPWVKMTTELILDADLSLGTTLLHPHQESLVQNDDIWEEIQVSWHSSIPWPSSHTQTHTIMDTTHAPGWVSQLASGCNKARKEKSLLRRETPWAQVWGRGKQTRRQAPTSKSCLAGTLEVFQLPLPYY